MKNLLKHWLLAATFVLLVALSLFTLTAQADPNTERARLAALVNEIDYLISQTVRIEKENLPAKGSTPRRLQFDYRTLNQDLHEVRAGIASYINRSVTLGREAPALTSSYTQESR